MVKDGSRGDLPFWREQEICGGRRGNSVGWSRSQGEGLGGHKVHIERRAERYWHCRGWNVCMGGRKFGRRKGSFLLLGGQAKAGTTLFSGKEGSSCGGAHRRVSHSLEEGVSWPSIRGKNGDDMTGREIDFPLCCDGTRLELRKGDDARDR